MAGNGSGKGDLNAHVATYGRMIGLMKWGALGVFAIAAMVVWLIAH